MITKTFTVNIDADTIAAALKNSEKTVRQMLRIKLDRALRKLANDAAKVASQTFGSAVTMSVKRVKGGFEIIASGEGGTVCFLEFGTGAFVQSQHPFANEMPFDIYPGSWSDTIGAGTWSQYIASHPDDPKGLNYPYNHKPRRGMYEAYKFIARNYERYIREEFK